ncbi:MULTISPECIES: DUF4926 domain-containing protein [Calidithermus]|uniref:DUF4926 domain-containing protein n=1 Tax=Calidithermus TaxID=2747271 RepID=UPI0009FC21D2|nr:MULTISPECIES: DUF4926 domain-containing protein [Calidithermus]
MSTQPLPPFALVRLISDAYGKYGLKIGDEGVIVDVYGDEAYEVDFTDSEGNPITFVAVKQGDVELVKP